MTAKTDQTSLALLRQPFAANQINLLPKQMRKDDQDRGKCEPNSRYSADGKYCGGYHARSIHLDYVGHAALTDRFLSVDPEWSWEPVAFAPTGLPAFDAEGGLWIRLTILGITRLGYGDAQGKKGPNAIKEAIGDALRNAGMRFGAALDLWHKGDLHDAATEQNSDSDPAPSSGDEFSAADAQRFAELITAATTAVELEAIRSDIAASTNIAGPARNDLRQQFSARQKELTA